MKQSTPNPDMQRIKKDGIPTPKDKTFPNAEKKVTISLTMDEAYRVIFGERRSTELGGIGWS
jgi:hypothetical protein